MPILGISYNKINAEKKSKPLTTNIRTTPKIVDVKKTKIAETKQDVLNISFSLQTDYGEYGSINIEGNIIYMGDNIEQAEKEWQENKKLPVDIDIEIKNYIIRKVVVQSLYISDLLNMPPVIELPRIVKKKENWLFTHSTFSIFIL